MLTAKNECKYYQQNRTIIKYNVIYFFFHLFVRWWLKIVTNFCLSIFFFNFCLYITSKLWEISGPNTNFDIGGFFWQVHHFYLILIFVSFLKNTNKHFFTWVFFSFSRYFYRLWVDNFHKSIFLIIYAQIVYHWCHIWHL